MKSKKNNRMTIRKADKTIGEGRAPDPKAKMLARVTKKKNYK